jgi:hypothetical protein
MIIRRIQVCSVAIDGLPDLTKYNGKLAFIYQGQLIFGKSIHPSSIKPKESTWESHQGEFYQGITHYVIFPTGISKLATVEKEEALDVAEEALVSLLVNPNSIAIGLAIIALLTLIAWIIKSTI